MVINGTTALVTSNGKVTRVCGHDFNKALKSTETVVFKLPSGDVVTPSKGLSWAEVAKLVRQGKQAQAAVGAEKKPRQRKSNPPPAPSPEARG